MHNMVPVMGMAKPPVPTVTTRRSRGTPHTRKYTRTMSTTFAPKHKMHGRQQTRQIQSKIRRVSDTVTSQEVL